MDNRLFLMRHFQTLENENEVYMGQQDYPVNYEHIKFDNTAITNIDSCILLSSPLLRATQSASYVINNTKRIKWRYEVSSLLKERGLGQFEGKAKNNFWDDPTFFSNKRMILSSTPPGGESIAAFCNRVNRIKPYISGYLKIDNVLLVTHLQVIRALLCKEITERSWYNISVSNGEIIELDPILFALLRKP